MAIKISVTIDDEVLAARRELHAERVSRDRLRALLAVDERDLGEIPDAARAHVNAQWPFSSLTPPS